MLPNFAICWKNLKNIYGFKTSLYGATKARNNQAWNGRSAGNLFFGLLRDITQKVKHISIMIKNRHNL
jgi:hypothetical protein